MAEPAAALASRHRAGPSRKPTPIPTGPALLRPLTPVPRGLDVLLASGGVALGLLWGWSIGSAAGYTFGWDGFLVVGVVLAGLGAMYALWAVLGRGAGWSLGDFGFRRSRSRHSHLWWQVPLLLTLNLGLALVLVPGAGEGSVDERAWEPAEVTALALLVVLVLPLLGELLLRRVLLDWWGAPGSGRMLAAGLVVAVLSGLMYGVPELFAYFAGLGVGLVLLRWWHGNLWAPLALHVTHNLVATVALATQTLR